MRQDGRDLTLMSDWRRSATTIAVPLDLELPHAPLLKRRLVRRIVWGVSSNCCSKPLPVEKWSSTAAAAAAAGTGCGFVHSESSESSLSEASRSGVDEYVSFLRFVVLPVQYDTSS